MDSQENNSNNSDIFDSWEDLDETGVLEKKFNDILSAKKKSGKYQRSKSTVNLILTGEDALRSQYVGPEPTVKILRRPKDLQMENGDRRRPLKPLRQREQEYAQARLKILGGVQQPISSPVAAVAATGATNAAGSSRRGQDCAGVAAAAVAAAAATAANAHTDGTSALPAEKRRCQAQNIARMPRGPDGTRGFNVKR